MSWIGHKKILLWYNPKENKKKNRVWGRDFFVNYFF